MKHSRKNTEPSLGFQQAQTKRQKRNVLRKVIFSSKSILKDANIPKSRNLLQKSKNSERSNVGPCQYHSHKKSQQAASQNKISLMPQSILTARRQRVEQAQDVLYQEQSMKEHTMQRQRTKRTTKQQQEGKDKTDIPRNMSQNIPKEIPKDISQYMPQDISQNISQLQEQHARVAQNIYREELQLMRQYGQYIRQQSKSYIYKINQLQQQNSKLKKSLQQTLALNSKEVNNNIFTVDYQEYQLFKRDYQEMKKSYGEMKDDYNSIYQKNITAICVSCQTQKNEQIGVSQQCQTQEKKQIEVSQQCQTQENEQKGVCQYCQTQENQQIRVLQQNQTQKNEQIGVCQQCQTQENEQKRVCQQCQTQENEQIGVCQQCQTQENEQIRVCQQQSQIELMEVIKEQEQYCVQQCSTIEYYCQKVQTQDAHQVREDNEVDQGMQEMEWLRRRVLEMQAEGVENKKVIEGLRRAMEEGARREAGWKKTLQSAKERMKLLMEDVRVVRREAAEQTRQGRRMQRRGQ